MVFVLAIGLLLVTAAASAHTVAEPLVGTTTTISMERTDNHGPIYSETTSFFDVGAQNIVTKGPDYYRSEWRYGELEGIKKIYLSDKDCSSSFDEGIIEINIAAGTDGYTIAIEDRNTLDYPYEAEVENGTIIVSKYSIIDRINMGPIPLLKITGWDGQPVTIERNARSDNGWVAY